MIDAAKSSNRFRLAVILAISSAMAFGSLWMLEIMRKGEEDAIHDARKSGPDYYLENFSFARLSNAGKVRYNIAGEKLSHLAQEDTFIIERPRIHRKAHGQSPLLAQANMGRIDHASSRMQMIGNVRVSRSTQDAHEKFEMTTEYLLVLPDDDKMETDQAVIIKMGTSTLSGIGMVANNATGEIQLLRKIHGIFPPPVSN